MKEIHGKLVYETLGEIVNPKHTAVLVVDTQNDTCTEGGHASRTPGMEKLVPINRKTIPNWVRFIDEARKSGILIVWIKNSYLPNWQTDTPSWLHLFSKVGMHMSDIPYYEVDTWGWEIIDELKPLPNEPIVRKYRADGFVHTCVDLVLRNNKIESVVIIGTSTRACVERTAVGATMHDYYSVMVKDCCAPYDETLVTVGSYDVATSGEIFKEWAVLHGTK